MGLDGLWGPGGGMDDRLRSYRPGGSCRYDDYTGAGGHLSRERCLRRRNLRQQTGDGEDRQESGRCTGGLRVQSGMGESVDMPTAAGGELGELQRCGNPVSALGPCEGGCGSGAPPPAPGRGDPVQHSDLRSDPDGVGSGFEPAYSGPAASLRFRIRSTLILSTNDTPASTNAGKGAKGSRSYSLARGFTG